jgi:two-component system, sensor histidine kinase and response regulator
LLDITDEIYLPVRILVVDDDRRNLNAMDAVLAPLGHDVICVQSGEEAIEVWRAHDFALGLIDVRMRGLDGFETAKHLTAVERNRAAPLVFVTGYDSTPETIQRGYACGAVDYVTKPVDPVLLRGKAKSLVLLYQRGAELKRKRQALLEAEAQATIAEERRRRAEEEKELQDMFVAILGHDLRNPISVVNNTATILRMSEGCDRCRGSADRLLRATARMNAIIDAVTDFAHQHFRGSIPVAPAPTDLADLCTFVVEEFSALHPKRSIVLEASAALRGSFDRARIEQVLSNLLTNALKHGKDPIVVTARQHAGSLCLAVRDRGGGIAPDQVTKIFDPFKKRPTSDGLGLGLFIVREIVRAHGGEVTVRSHPGEGTTFTCHWPAAGSVSTGLDDSAVRAPRSPACQGANDQSDY